MRWIISKVLEEGRKLFEEEVAGSAENAGIVGVDADEKTNSSANEKVDDEGEENKFHPIWIYNLLLTTACTANLR